jgi:AraC family transcriptional regulator
MTYPLSTNHGLRLCKIGRDVEVESSAMVHHRSAATGTRPHDYVLRRRIERAQDLLRNSETGLVDIALGVGFQSQSHFTTVFKRFVGETPHRWRQLTRNDHALESSAELSTASHCAAQTRAEMGDRGSIML